MEHQDTHLSLLSSERKPRLHSLRRYAGPLLLLCLLLASTPARAQDAAAGALFDSGVADMNAGRYQTGCPAIAESQRLDPRPGTLFSLAECMGRWGRIATAVARFTDYIALYDRMPEDKKADPVQAERYQQATDKRAMFLPDVPQLTLSLPKDAPVGTVVKRNGEVVGAAALGLSIPVDPGKHTIITQAPGGVAREHVVIIAKGEKKQVTLEITPPERAQPAQPPQPVEPVSTGSSGRQVAGYFVGGVGLAGLVVGGVMGGLSMSKRDASNDGHCDKQDICDTTGVALRDDALLFGNVSTAAFIASGVLAGAGIVLLATAPRSSTATVGKSAEVRVSPGGIAIAGRF